MSRGYRGGSSPSVPTCVPVRSAWAQAATATPVAATPTTESGNSFDVLGGLGGIPATLGSWWNALSGGVQTLAQDAGSTLAASTTTSTPAAFPQT